ncbi:hypothetical protein ALC62_10132 [Cyphomyrmex costatus]|uniref:Gustatory receptor n=1 Tax=Cyphomyrmex costatus TaxID=456900 RepID=A0A195CGE9_9HYME|nr:hypothetical protein ALC62_10132 [Cyphomyrmex costatus]
MSKTLMSVLTPLFIISSFYCLILFEYPLGQQRPYFSCLYGLTVWSIIVYNTYPIFIVQLEEKRIFISHDIHYLIAISSIFISLYRYKELKICLRELSVVNDTLETLGAPNEYHRIRNWIIRVIIGCIVFVFYDMITTVFFIKYYGSSMDSKGILNVRLIFNILTVYYPLCVNILSALICGTVLRCTSSRFHQVNDRLCVLYSDIFENNAVYRYRKQNKSILVRECITAKDRKQSTWILM